MKTCGCKPGTCGCCAGTQNWTPLSVENPPGMPELQYRVGTHATFFESMKARIASTTVVAPGADGQTLETFRPLEGLTTRSSTDPAIAVLDGWAMAADILTFYQERIANEGYLRTARERRSVLELARLVGYTLRPGVASTVYLAYTLEDQQPEPVSISAGSRSQSVPGPDEMPQSFETSDDLLARAEWNNLKVRRSWPQNITLVTAMQINSIWIAGGQTTLKTGDLILLIFGEDGKTAVVRSVASAQAEFMADRTEIQLKPVRKELAATVPALLSFVAEARSKIDINNSGAPERMVRRAIRIQNETLLGLPSDPSTWVSQMFSAADGSPGPVMDPMVAEFNAEIQEILDDLGSPQTSPVTTEPAKFIAGLLKRPEIQPRSSQRLARTLTRSFALGSDASPQLLIQREPRLKDNFYRAWSNAQVNAATPALSGIFKLQAPLSLFGATVPRMATFTNNVLNTPDKWTEWDLANDEQENTMFLEKVEDSILTDTWTMIQTDRIGEPVSRGVYRVAGAETTQRSAYAISGKQTRLTLTEEWWNGSDDSMSTLRATLVFPQAETYTLIEEPLKGDVSGQEIELGLLYNELKSGRWVIFSGERADIPGVTGVRVSELLMISGLTHDYDPALPGDKTHTTLQLATPTAYKYKRDSLIIYANVVKATHGETRNEILGSGDAGASLQSFTLKQPPLTFVPSPTPSGIESTLHVSVNDVEWHETDSLAALGPKDRGFTTKTDDEAKTTVVFGTGANGTRVPTGVENVKAVYRNGIGKSGNVKAGQISMLMTRPQGVKEVINPLRASGGADKESRDEARDNAPVAIHALDRLVSIQDYADFSRTFAGIAKSSARLLSDGQRQLIHLTIAGADDIPIDRESDLYRNLVEALVRYAAPGLALQVDTRELVTLVLSANVRIHSDYKWEPVVNEIRASILDAFGFHKRALGQPALLCEMTALIQNIPGVLYVDIDSFGGVPEKKTVTDDDTGRKTRELLTPDEISSAVNDIANPSTSSTSLSPIKPGPAKRVDVSLATVSQGLIQPAQLAIFTPAVPDTLILNQIA